MIFAVVIGIGGFIISLFVATLHYLNWSFPPQIFNAFQVAFNTLHTFASFLPWIGDMIAILLVLLPAHAIKYIFNILRWVWSLVPWIGTRTEYPNMAPIDLRQPHHMDRNTLDLRNKKKSPRRTMKDIKKP